MTVDYDCMADLLAHIDNEGLAYFFGEHTDAKEIRVAGERLPVEVTVAASALKRAMRDLEYWVDRQNARLEVEKFDEAKIPL